MQQRARVLSVNGNKLSVKVLPDGAGDCAESCGSCKCCGSVDTPLEVDSKLTVSPGQIVIVDVNMPSPAVAAAIIFIVPLCSMTCIGILAYHVGVRSDGWLVASAGAGLVLGGLFAWLGEKLLRRLGVGARAIKVE